MADDVAEIHDLMHRYAELFDSGQLEPFAELFARGRLTFRGLDAPCVGAAGVLDFIERRVILYKGRPRTNHVVSNIVVEVAPDRATASAQSHVTVYQATRELPLQVVITGRYTDALARDEAGWYFIEREAWGGLRGNISQHLRLDPAPPLAPVNGLAPDIEALADRFITAVEAGDPDAIRACCTSDVVVWHNYDDLEVGLDSVLPMLAVLAERVPDVHYAERRRRPIEGGYLQQHVVRGTAPSGALALPAAMFITVRDGLIARLEEYLDREGLSVLRRPRPS